MSKAYNNHLTGRELCRQVLPAILYLCYRRFQCLLKNCVPLAARPRDHPARGHNGGTVSRPPGAQLVCKRASPGRRPPLARTPVFGGPGERSLLTRRALSWYNYTRRKKTPRLGGAPEVSRGAGTTRRLNRKTITHREGRVARGDCIPGCGKGRRRAAVRVPLQTARRAAARAAAGPNIKILPLLNTKLTHTPPARSIMSPGGD